MEVDEARLWRKFAESKDPAIREELVNETCRSPSGSLCATAVPASPSTICCRSPTSVCVNAVDRFDPERGIPFTAFASPTILGELKRHFRDRVWTVRVPRGLHDRMAEVDKAITELTKQLQRSPSVGEIAEALELEQTDVLEVLEANHNRRPLSLDRPAGGEDSDEAPPSEWVGERGRALRAGRGTDRPRCRAALSGGARAHCPAPALRRGHDPVADRRADRPLADARLPHPAPRPQPASANRSRRNAASRERLGGRQAGEADDQVVAVARTLRRSNSIGQRLQRAADARGPPARGGSHRRRPFPSAPGAARGPRRSRRGRAARSHRRSAPGPRSAIASVIRTASETRSTGRSRRAARAPTILASTGSSSSARPTAISVPAISARAPFRAAHPNRHLPAAAVASSLRCRGRARRRC